MNNQETDIFPVSLICRHHFAIKKGLVSGRYYDMCTICAKVLTWYPIPEGATLRAPRTRRTYDH
jgi:hypothetical protein